MDKKKVLLLIRIVILLAFAGVTVYLYLNSDRTGPVYAPETGGIMRRYLTEGLAVEGTTGYIEGISVEYHDNNSDITRKALKKAGIDSGVLSAAVYEMIYTPKDESVSSDAAETTHLMCSATLKGDLADKDGELCIYKVDENKATTQQMFMKDNDPAWISEGVGTYLIVRLYPEELLVAEEEPEPTPEEVEEPEGTPTPKPKATPTPVPADQQGQPEGTRYATVDLNVRTEPNRASKALGTVKPGTALEGVEETDDPEWLKIDYNGETGYVSAQYVGTR